MDDEIPYLLLTPGPLTTSPTVKRVMLFDYCTWDDDYNRIVTGIRQRLVALAGAADDYTSVLVQGSGTFAVEATLGSLIPPAGKLLVVNNGAYGSRMAQIAQRLRIDHRVLSVPEVESPDPLAVRAALEREPGLSHVAMVHCETTTGMLNPAAEVGQICRELGRVFLVDAMSSFGGLPLSMDALSADALISSANKCLQGVPGFGLVVVRRELIERSSGWARSLSLDLFDQWREMERSNGKWRFTSPTHTVRAFAQALVELDAEGGVPARFARYRENHQVLVAGYESLGLRPLLPSPLRSPIITSFVYPDSPHFTFLRFYEAMKRRRFVLYPGKVSQAETFRVGTIGHVFPDDFRRLIVATRDALAELKVPCGA